MFRDLAAEWHDLRADAPGEPFRHHYERARRHSHLRRIVGGLFGVILVAAGFVMLFIPGPGILTAIFGLALLSSQSHWLASTMDRAEPRLRAWFDRLRQRFRR